MPIVLEAEDLTGKQVAVPKEVSNNIQQNLNLVGKNNKMVTQSKGYKRGKSLTSPNYNNRQSKHNYANQTSDGRKIVSASDLKKTQWELNHMSNNPDNLQYFVQGGDVTRNWVDQALGQVRNSVKQVKAVPQVPKLSKTVDNKLNAQNMSVKSPSKTTNEGKTIFIKESQLKTLYNIY